ncbi:MAG: hypothetical protein U0793_11355 [Gemmataceae bacterium]
MDTLAKKVKSLLEEGFPPPDVVELEDNDGLLGIVVSKRFKNLDSMDRVNLMWKYLEKELTAKEARQVVLLIGMTPREKLLHSST